MASLLYSNSSKCMFRRVLELQKENELLKNKINNFISDSQDFQKKQVEEKTPIVRPPASPSIPNIKVVLIIRLSLTTILLGTRQAFPQISYHMHTALFKTIQQSSI